MSDIHLTLKTTVVVSLSIREGDYRGLDPGQDVRKTAWFF
jgi:hypothetical protein